MILGVNGIRLSVARSGVARCIEALLRCLEDLDHPFTRIRVYTPSPVADDTYLPPIAENVVLPSKLPFAAWEQITLPKAHGSKDLLLCPSYVSPITARCPTFLIHHGSYEGYPKAFDWWTLNKARMIYSMSAKRATGLSTVSEYSKRDMVKYYGVAADKINVIPEGVDTRIFRPNRDTAMLSSWRTKIFGEDVPFITYIGKPTERRNLSALIRAFAELKKDGYPHKFLICGASLPGTSPFRKVVDELGLHHDVFVLDYVTHDEMPLVYNAASLFIYPSSYEGFGMPVLEAMACGTPVIALDNTAFPEFAGGVAHLLKDAKVETLKEGMMAVLSDSSWQKQMSEDGPKRAAAYDWRILTQRYLDLMVPLAN
jgi:glycosyltransferase involved in cell wall biosynthesis